jgi:hypothetical protein
MTQRGEKEVAKLLNCPGFQTLETWNSNASSFFCEVQFSIIRWIIIIVTIMVFGFSYIALESSIGISLENQERWKHLGVTIFLVSTFRVVPFIPFANFQPGDLRLFYPQLIAHSLGFLIMLQRVTRDFGSFASKKLVPDMMQSNGVLYETYAKRAAMDKIKYMQENAVGLISYV